MGLQLSGSVQLEGNLLVTGSANSVFENISVTNRITANEINVQFVSSSIIYSSGSNKFGDEITDNHQFTGSLIISGTLAMGIADTGVGRISFNESTNTLRIQSSKDGTDCTPIEFWSQKDGGGFAQSMIISGSNVGIGTINTRGVLDISSGLRTGTLSGLFVGADVDTTAGTRTNNTRKVGMIASPHYSNASDSVFGIAMDNQAANNFIYIGGGYSGYNPATAIVFSTGLTTTTGTGTEAMRITPSGSVGMGTNNPTAKLQVSTTPDFKAILKISDLTTESTGILALGDGGSGAINVGVWRAAPNSLITYGNYLNLGGYNGIVFATGTANIGSQTERVRITEGGYFKASNNGIYNNATGTFHEFSQNLNGASSAILAHSGASDPYGVEVNFTGHDPNNATNYMFGAYTTSGGFAWIYRIFSNGTVSGRSDARWKKNIETTRNGYIDDLCKLRVVKYNWYNHEDDAPKELGLIAQEVEEVFPNLIQIDPVIAKREVEQEDGTIIEEEFEDGVSRSIKTSVLPFMLLKAIQEQQEQIEELKSRIEQLEKN
jgi:hypothetical protein